MKKLISIKLKLIVIMIAVIMFTIDFNLSLKKITNIRQVIFLHICMKKLAYIFNFSHIFHAPSHIWKIISAINRHNYMLAYS